MARSKAVGEAPSRLKSLLGYLEVDPENLSLLETAAECAFQEGDLEAASALLGRYEAKAPLPAQLRNLRGLVALSSHRFDLASAQFEGLLDERPEDAGLRFNLAWSRAMVGDFARTAELIDEPTMAAVPRAATLKVQALHHLGRMDEALELGRAVGAGTAANGELLGALSSVALDSDQPDLARTYALKAGDAPEALATLGMLDLNNSSVAAASRLFDKALKAQPNNARALLGKGLAKMSAGEAEAAIPLIDQSAALFGRHLGSWIAAGWACFAAGDLVGARKRFETALAIDDTFAEIHGGLAVLDVVQGREADAQRRVEVALRLDRNCFSAALARMLLLQAKGQDATAARIRDAALNTPIGASGRTLGQAMAAFAQARTKRPTRN